MHFRLSRISASVMACALFSATPDLGATGQCDTDTVKWDSAAAVNACSATLANKRLSPEERSQALKLRGRALGFQHYIDHAITDLDEALKLTPLDHELAVERGWAAFDKQNYEYATELANRVIKDKPDYAEGHYLLATIKVWKHEDFAGAKRELDTAITLDPTDALKYRQRFFLNFRWGLYPEALAALDESLGASGDGLDWKVATLMGVIKMPMRLELRIRHAWLLSEMGRYQDAMRDFDGVVQKYPGVISYSFRAEYAYQRHDLKQAQADIDVGYTYQPDFWFLNRIQGQIYLHEKKFDRALTIFTHLLTQINVDGQFYWWRSMAWRGLNRNEEATKDALIAMTDNGFAKKKLPTLIELGYYQASSPGQEWAALKDALTACFLDDRCN